MADEVFFLDARTLRDLKNLKSTVDMLSKQMALVAGARQVTPPQRTDHFYNQSGETIPAFSVFYADDGADLERRRYVTAKQVTTTFPKSIFVSGSVPVIDKDFGALQCGQLLLIKYDTGTPAFGEIWGFKPGQWTLVKGYYGFQCQGIWDEESKIMLARPMIPNYIGKRTGAVSKSSSADFDVYTKASGSWAAIPSWKINAECTFADYVSTKFVELTQIGNQWVAMNLEC